MSQRDKIFEMLREFETVMLVTLGPDGRIESRPMQVVDIDERTGNVWFFTARGIFWFASAHRSATRSVPT